VSLLCVSSVRAFSRRGAVAGVTAWPVSLLCVSSVAAFPHRRVAAVSGRRGLGAGPEEGDDKSDV
jgi:hypothetical protein